VKALLLPFLAACAAAAPVPLFDGKTLDGWEVPPGEAKWWRVQDGAITGGSLDEKVPKNTFLASTRRFGNFDLRFKIRLVKGDGFMNSGMQVRSRRDGSAMSGYQVDAGTGYWGDLYDEHRRNRKIAGALDPAALNKVVRDWDWNDYRILCEGPRIRSWINGVAALDYVEKDPAIALDGLLGIQTHGGGKLLVQVKDITIEELAAPADDRSPEAEKASFQLPPGFEAELVASEKEGVGKPVTVAWDAAGRMWTMTALEYPVDANENAATAEALFRSGGKDRVLVFDHPSRPGPQTPRVFVEGLAIPLGILPWRGGVLVQHGHDIRYYEDRNRDGRADGHRVVLGGFGIQDSHLFPHQFERSPGGWFLLAQGLFNSSTVVRPDGSPFANGALQVDFNQCKLARARLDGSAFELLTAGPNNIWGFASARDGTEFLQEANDMGIPVAEFIAGTHYRTGSKEKLRPYAPQLPPTTPGQPLGGSGLSGIALAEDAGCPFAAIAPDAKNFFIANPITNRIQIVTLDAAGNYRKRDDFLVSSDPWFRPVALHFGPDGCLYLVDWYNKIISHNEVPRMHPDRDKTRGRIWRIKPTGHVPEPMPDLTKLPVRELLDHLGGRRARVAALAWQELGDRKDPAATPLLEELATARTQPTARRLGALWALQEMAALSPSLLAGLARDTDPHVRREAIDAAGDLALAEAAFLALVPPGERDHQVRCALANALRRHASATPAMAAAIAPLAEAPAAGCNAANDLRTSRREVRISTAGSIGA
jgi:putative membrane-bound dehydrogenase-like protein